MIQGQYDPPSGQQCNVSLQTPHVLHASHASRLLQQHPVLIPAVLLGASLGLCIVGFFADTLFPVLAIIGTPATLVCLLIALVLGIVGILASIISIIENVDRKRQRVELFSEPKEGA